MRLAPQYRRCRNGINDPGASEPARGRHPGDTVRQRAAYDTSQPRRSSSSTTTVSRARPAWLRALVANSSISPGSTGYAYGRHAVPEHRRLIGNCLALLLPRPLVRAPAAPAAPSVLETTVVRKGAVTIVHLLSFAPERRGELDIVEEALPLVELPISIRTDRPPKRVELAPHGERLDHEYLDGYVTVRVTVRESHGMGPRRLVALRRRRDHDRPSQIVSSCGRSRDTVRTSPTRSSAAR